MKYVIFDMDGVIVDTEPEYRRRTKSFFESMGYQISEELYDLTCGSNWKHTYELFRKYVKEFDMEYEEYVEKRKHYGNYEAIDPGKYVDEHIYPLVKEAQNPYCTCFFITKRKYRAISDITQNQRVF